ncbi:MFS transporter [Nocardia sp. NPDC004068]|uniref:MFS transporter n=1 Tax=Nocardia sp. NPDC004068 TaxID=3364303 RepID=UPI003674E1DF
MCGTTSFGQTRLGAVVQYALLAGPLLSMLDSSIVNVAAAPIAEGLGAGLDAVGWTVSGYLLALGAGLAGTSYLARRFGTLPVYRVALLAFTLASLACAAAPDIGVLIAARAVQGLAGAPLVPLAMSMLLGGGGATRAMSPVAGILLFLGPALGPSVGGMLVVAAGWRSVFLINVPIAGLAVLAARRIPGELAPGRARDVRFDPVGMVFLAAGSTLMLYGTGRAGTSGWPAPQTVSSLSTGLVLLAAYVRWARRRAHPAVSLDSARTPGSLLALGLCASASVATFAAVFLLPVFLQTAQGRSVAMTGLAMLPQGVVTGLGTIAGQRVLTRFSVRATVVGGFVVLAAASAGMLIIDARTPLAVTATVLAARAAAVGLVITPLLAGLLDPLRDDQLADANTLFTICQRIGASLGVAGISAWYAATAATRGPVGALHAVALALLVLTALSAALSTALPGTRNTAVLGR